MYLAMGYAPRLLVLLIARFQSDTFQGETYDLSLFP